MSPKKFENEREKKSSGFRPGAGGRSFDASPGAPGENGQPGGPNKRQDLQNLTEHQAWKQSTGAASKMWARYVELLRTSFIGMSRDRQVQLITNASQIVCVGLTALVLSYFYKFFPLFARVAIVPIAIIGAWWIGSNIVADAMIERFSKYLNQEF